MKARLSFAHRTFLFAFIPMVCTLIITFVAIEGAVEDRIKDRLRDSLLKTEAVISQWEAEYTDNSQRALAAFAANTSLRYALALLRDNATTPDRGQAIETVAAQLVDIGAALDFDLLVIQDPQGESVVGLIGPGRARLDLSTEAIDSISAKLLQVRGTLYESVSVPVNQGYENLGTVVLGKQFSTRTWNDFGHTILIGPDGSILDTTLLPAVAASVARQISGECGDFSRDCELSVSGETYLALPVRRRSLGAGVRLVSLQSVDAAASEFTRSVAGVFPMIGGGGILVLILLSVVGSRSVARPLVNLVTHLRHERQQGSFPAVLPHDYEATEVNALAQEFTRAAGAIRESERRLDEATEQFIASMTQAQDARDPHTAGHSDRVSFQAVEIARAMGLSSGAIETIRIGARLHDLGKIGIPDAVLRKPGPLTGEEYALIQRHPRIGHEILEKVDQFEPFLPIVELHHENPDGSGYPYGLREDEIPIGVRIVHVADVYDAITSDRAYRAAMSEEQAWDLLMAGMGTLFDPEVIEALWSILQRGPFPHRAVRRPPTHENDSAFYSLPRSR
jgi:HD-GYP domain-containing protein (c-di-GMP phosphodiesterase class II)